MCIVRGGGWIKKTLRYMKEGQMLKKIRFSSRKKNQEWDLAWQGDFWKKDFFSALKYQIITQAAHDGKSAVQQRIPITRPVQSLSVNGYYGVDCFSRQLEQMTSWVPFISNLLIPKCCTWLFLSDSILFLFLSFNIFFFLIT